MGRTIQPYSIQLERMRDRFSKFRRSLRREDQEIFDEMFRFAKANVQAGVMAAAPNPMDSILLSILLEQQRQIQQLQTDLQKLKNNGPEIQKQNEN